MLAFRMFELVLVEAIQICIQNWPNFENISHDTYQKMQQNKTLSRTLTENCHAVDIESTMNPFFPTCFLTKVSFLLSNFDELNVLAIRGWF